MKRSNFFFKFEIQTDHLISARRLDEEIVNKKRTCRKVDFAVPADHRVKLKEIYKKDKYLDLARELEKLFVWAEWRTMITQLQVDQVIT